MEDIIKEHENILKEHYYIKSSGNCDLSTSSDPHNEFMGKNVLIERNSTSAMASKLGMPVEQYLEILCTCRRKLFDVRSKRPRPHLDDKVSLVTLQKDLLYIKEKLPWNLTDWCVRSLYHGMDLQFQHLQELLKSSKVNLREQSSTSLLMVSM